MKIKLLGRIAKRTLLILFIAIYFVMDSGMPAFAQATIKPDSDDAHKGDLYYYTQNNIIFYEGGLLRCSDGTSVVSGAAEILQAQKNLDRQWIPVILNTATEKKVDPIAMAALLFWEHRGFPKYGAGPSNDESDTIGRGPWQITAGSWNRAYGAYSTNVYDPVIATKVAAELVKSWGGQAGIPIGSIDQDFSKLKNIPSMATVAKNYNAGKYTWRTPAVATYKQSGRDWVKPEGSWGSFKAGVIDDYIVGMTFAYYTMATNSGQLSKGGGTNTDTFVEAGLKVADKIKSFKFGVTQNTSADANISEECGATGSGNGDIVKTALGLAWPNQKYDGHQEKTDARPSYRTAMPAVQGTGTANSIFINNGRRYTAWSDCGVFVATTVRYSGADKKYKLRGTGEQREYVIANGKKSDPNRKYDVFDGDNNPLIKDKGKLLPGDIMIVNGDGVGHTYLYIGDGTANGTYKGDDGRKYDSAGASWGDHVPIATNAYLTQSGYPFIVARLRAKPAAAATTNTATGGTTQP